MVVFGCATCGESLKKPQVEKHGNMCRMTSISCFDCFKDFDRITYQEHFTCVTEQERVQGSLYKAKENKTEVKRGTWGDCVIKAAKEATDPQVGKILNIIKKETNIPMKLAPFKNFLKNKKAFFGDRPSEAAFNAVKDLYAAMRGDNYDFNGRINEIFDENPNGIEAAEALRLIIKDFKEKHPESNITPQQLVDKIIPLVKPHVGTKIIC